MFRFPAVGGISGDWGGGHDIGEMALWFALRAQDGRGERTSLATLVPAHFGLRRPRQVMEAMYFHRLDEDRVIELLCDLLARGLADRILLSQDVCHDSQLKRYGGNGYVYLVETFLPRLREAGASQYEITTMTEINPRRLLTIGETAESRARADLATQLRAFREALRNRERPIAWRP